MNLFDFMLIFKYFKYYATICSLFIFILVLIIICSILTNLCEILCNYLYFFIITDQTLRVACLREKAEEIRSLMIDQVTVRQVAKQSNSDTFLCLAVR